MFLVDGSGSIENQGRGNFQRTKDFISELVQTFNIGRDEVNVAAVLYSSSPQIILRLNTHYTKEEIITAIQEMPYPGGGTRTGRALDTIRNIIFDGLGERDDLPKIVIVITDGFSHDDVESPSRKLRDSVGATIISLGVGCCFHEPELNAMATDPDEDHVFEVSFSHFENIKDSLRARICVGKYNTRYVFFALVVHKR